MQARYNLSDRIPYTSKEVANDEERHTQPALLLKLQEEKDVDTLGNHNNDDEQGVGGREWSTTAARSTAMMGQMETRIALMMEMGAVAVYSVFVFSRFALLFVLFYLCCCCCCCFCCCSSFCGRWSGCCRCW